MSNELGSYFACGHSNATCKCTCGVEGVQHICELTFEGWEEWTDPDGGGGTVNGSESRS